MTHAYNASYVEIKSSMLPGKLSPGDDYPSQETSSSA